MRALLHVRNGYSSKVMINRRRVESAAPLITASLRMHVLPERSTSRVCQPATMLTAWSANIEADKLTKIKLMPVHVASLDPLAKS
jgi:hypothetical protein